MRTQSQFDARRADLAKIVATFSLDDAAIMADCIADAFQARSDTQRKAFQFAAMIESRDLVDKFRDAARAVRYTLPPTLNHEEA
jgi:hypothetical protein